MRRRAAILAPCLLALDILIIALLLVAQPGHGDDLISYVGLATLVRIVLSVSWIMVSGTFKSTLIVTVLLLGLEALTSVFLFWPGRTVGSETQEWAMLPVLMANIAMGPALLILLVVYLIAQQVARRRAENSR